MWQAILNFLEEVFAHKTNDNPNEPVTINPAPSVPMDTPYKWDTKENCRHSVRVICDEEGLGAKDKNDLSATVHCESNYNPNCIHPNIVNGKVSSTDYGIAQINDYWHIGSGKDFATKEDALNPEKAIRWMARQWKAGRARQWVCYDKSLFINYSS